MEKTINRAESKETKERLKQFDEMEQIWRANDESTKAYLEGCIHTAVALSMRDKKAG